MRNIDKLTSDERMNRLINGETLDRVPVIPHAESFAGKVIGISSKDFYLNPDLAYKAQVKCKEVFQHDGGIDYFIASGTVVDFGGEIKFKDEPKSAYPKVIKRAITCEADLDNLEMPDVFECFTGKRYLEFNLLARKDNRSVGTFAGSPTTMAENLIDMELLMKWMIRKPECVHRIMRFVTDYIILRGKAYKERFGSENVEAGMSLPVESNGIMSPKQFEKFTLPYIVEIFEKFDEMGIDIGSIHLCGKHQKNLKYWKNNIKLKPRTLITVGHEMDLVELGKEMGEDYILGGNLRNLTLQTGTPRDVYNEAKEIIESMKYFKGGFVLTPDCTLSYLTPMENLHAMIEAAREVGKY